MLDMWTTVYMWTTPNVCVTFSLSLIVRWQGTTLGTTYLVWWQVTCSSNNSFHLASSSFEEESKMMIYLKILESRVLPVSSGLVIIDEIVINIDELVINIVVTITAFISHFPHHLFSPGHLCLLSFVI